MKVIRKSRQYEGRVKELGVVLPDRPQDSPPDIPKDISDLTDADIMSLWVTYTAWTDYLSAQVVHAVYEEKQAERAVSRAEARALLSGEKVTVARAQVKVSDEMERLYHDHLESEMYRKLLEAMFNNYDRDAALLSRELTRRTSDVRGRKDRWQS